MGARGIGTAQAGTEVVRIRDGVQHQKQRSFCVGPAIETQLEAGLVLGGQRRAQRDQPLMGATADGQCIQLLTPLEGDARAGGTRLLDDLAQAQLGLARLHPQLAGCAVTCQQGFHGVHAIDGFQATGNLRRGGASATLACPATLVTLSAAALASGLLISGVTSTLADGLAAAGLAPLILTHCAFLTDDPTGPVTLTETELPPTRQP